MKKKLEETLEENKNSIELSLINFLMYIFKISDYVDEKKKIILGSKILKDINFNDYFSLGLLLDEIDFKNFNKNQKEISEIKKILSKYKNTIIEKLNELLLEPEFKLIENFLEKLINNLTKITESLRDKKTTEREISKIYKPKIDTSKTGISGPFKKDTKTARLKKDPYDRKFFKKNKKVFLDEMRKIDLNALEKEDFLLGKNEKITDEKKEQIINNLEFLYINMRDFSDDYLNNINSVLKKLCKKMETIFKTNKEIF